MIIKEKIRTIQDYPKKGIFFRDITTLLQDPLGFKMVVEQLVQHYKNLAVDYDLIVGIEARGFILGGALAFALGKGFIPIRKKGKLPAKVISQSYELEYGSDRLEIHEDAIKPQDNVLVVDDLLATGGTAMAAAGLINQLKGKIVEFAFIVNLPSLGGYQKLISEGYSIFYLTEFNEDPN